MNPYTTDLLRHSMDSNSHKNYHHRSSFEQRQYGGDNYSFPGPGLGGLSRYRSAPSSRLADFDFLCPPSSPETEQILERFISGTIETTARAMESGNEEAEIPMAMKREETGEGFAEQRSYASPVSRDMGMEYMVVGGGTEAAGVFPSMGGYIPSSLVRHSSSPAGLFDDMNIDGGEIFRTTFAERPVSRLRGTMSSIHEIGKKNIIEVTTSTRSYLAGFPIVSFDEGRLSPGNLFLDRQKGGIDDMDVFSGGQIDEEEEVHRTLPLAHHLSLPKKSSADITAIENFLQLKDSVPCKVRAKRGCATHPRSIAERVRRTKISERIRKLQDLVPNMDKQTNTADMLDLAVDYIKELQGEVKTLSNDRDRCTCSNMKFL